LANPEVCQGTEVISGISQLLQTFCQQVCRHRSSPQPPHRNKGDFLWTSEHQHAFDSLRKALISPPVLDHPTRANQFILSTDASDSGLGAVLSTGRRSVIEYASRALTPAEMKYTTTEKKCLAIVWAVWKLRHFLLGASFILETDHKPLLWLESAKASQARSQSVERWSLKPVSLLALEPFFTAPQLSQAQRTDPVLSTVIRRLETKADITNDRKWNKFPLHRYRQLWSQLSLQEDLLCQEMIWQKRSF